MLLDSVCSKFSPNRGFENFLLKSRRRSKRSILRRVSPSCSDFLPFPLIEPFTALRLPTELMLCIVVFDASPILAGREMTCDNRS